MFLYNIKGSMEGPYSHIDEINQEILLLTQIGELDIMDTITEIRRNLPIVLANDFQGYGIIHNNDLEAKVLAYLLWQQIDRPLMRQFAGPPRVNSALIQAVGAANIPRWDPWNFFGGGGMDYIRIARNEIDNYNKNLAHGRLQVAVAAHNIGSHFTDDRDIINAALTQIGKDPELDQRLLRGMLLDSANQRLRAAYISQRMGGSRNTQITNEYLPQDITDMVLEYLRQRNYNPYHTMGVPLQTLSTPLRLTRPVGNVHESESDSSSTDIKTEYYRNSRGQKGGKRSKRKNRKK